MPTWCDTFSLHLGLTPSYQRTRYQAIRAVVPTPAQNFPPGCFNGDARKNIRTSLQDRDFIAANPHNQQPGALPVFFPDVPTFLAERNQLAADLGISANLPNFDDQALGVINGWLGGALNTVPFQKKGNSLVAFGAPPAAAPRVLAVLADNADAIMILRAWANHPGTPHPYTIWLTQYNEKMACLALYPGWPAFRV